MKKLAIVFTLISASLLTFNVTAEPHKDHGQMNGKNANMAMMKKCMTSDNHNMDHSKMDSATKAVMEKCMENNKEMSHDAKTHSESKGESAHSH